MGSHEALCLKDAGRVVSGDRWSTTRCNWPSRAPVVLAGGDGEGDSRLVGAALHGPEFGHSPLTTHHPQPNAVSITSLSSPKQLSSTGSYQ